MHPDHETTTFSLLDLETIVSLIQSFRESKEEVTVQRDSGYRARVIYVLNDHMMVGELEKVSPDGAKATLPIQVPTLDLIDSKFTLLVKVIAASRRGAQMPWNAFTVSLSSGRSNVTAEEAIRIFENEIDFSSALNFPDLPSNILCDILPTLVAPIVD